jgi:peroxiredoxin
MVLLNAMTRTARTLWLLSCLIAGVILAADPAPPVPSQAQADSTPIPAERLAVRAESGDSIPFADLIGADGRAVCFAFLHPACPLAQEYGPVLGELAVAFANEGIRFVGVVCECDDSGDIEEYRKTYGITFPIYTDTDFQLAEALDATITPEVVLVDRDRRIRYAGRIDDRYKIRGVMSPGDPDHELRAAILDLVAGREIDRRGRSRRPRPTR